jgi:hypothetical protein
MKNSAENEKTRVSLVADTRISEDADSRML